MKLTFLTHVVPTLSAEPDGAGGYPLELARQLREHCEIDSQFILCDPNWNGPAQLAGFAVRRLRFPNEARLWGMLASLKNPGAVMLHYDGYGYDKHGIPAWLYLGIKSWLNDQGTASTSLAKQLFTVFHDLWKTEPKPWRAKFYLQARQKSLVARLHRLSKASITCGQHRHCQLETIEPGKTIQLPISNNLPVLFDSPHGGDIACTSGRVMARPADGRTSVLRNGENADPLQADVHFPSSDDSFATAGNLSEMARVGEPDPNTAAGRQWCQKNAEWKIIAMKYQAVLETQGPLSPPPPWPVGMPFLNVATASRQPLTIAGS